MYAEQGKGYRSLADTLNQEGIPTPRGPKWSHIYTGLWTDWTMRSILVNPIYAGDMIWNRRTDHSFVRSFAAHFCYICQEKTASDLQEKTRGFGVLGSGFLYVIISQVRLDYRG